MIREIGSENKKATIPNIKSIQGHIHSASYQTLINERKKIVKCPHQTKAESPQQDAHGESKNSLFFGLKKIKESEF